MLDLDRLRALHAVATYGSVGAAASALNVTTSAVSQKLAKLERETRARLVERHGRGVRLTDAAMLLVEHTEEILARVERAESDFESQRGEVFGRVTLDAFATALRGLLPPVMATVSERYPRLTVHLREAEPPDSVRDVVRGNADIAVVQDWHSIPLEVPDGLERAALVDDIADLAMAASHPLAGRRSVSLRSVLAGPWVSSPPGAVCHDLLVHTIRSYDAEPTIMHVASEYETQLTLVAAGLGLAILPRLGRGALPDGVVTLPTRPVLARSVYAIWRSQVGRRPVIRAVFDVMREVAAGAGRGRSDRQRV